ncbi:MAG: hypothetical protein ABIO24_08100, partial [Saprospiraceae bacterium]
MDLFKKIFGASQPPEPPEGKTPPVNFQEGDIFYIIGADRFEVFKVLRVDNSPSPGLHVNIFKPLSTLPTAGQANTLEIFAYHAPIALEGFHSPVVITNLPVTDQDLLGYFEY